MNLKKKIPVKPKAATNGKTFKSIDQIRQYAKNLDKPQAKKKK